MSPDDGGAADFDLSEKQLRLLLRAGQTLGSSLDLSEALQQAASLMIPDAADWCAVDLLDDDGGVELVAVAHADPEKVEWARHLRERYPVDLDAAEGIGQVIRSGEPLLMPEVSQDLLRETARDAEHLEAIEKVGFRSALAVPLRTPHATIGALTFVASETDRRYGEQDVRFALEFAQRAALAVDNARLFQWSRELNSTLERRVAEQMAQVRELASEVASAEARERDRIAQLLHDDLQQRLHALQFQLVELRELSRSMRSKEFEGVYDETAEALREASATTRSLTGELSPVALHREDFPTAVRWLAGRFRDQHGLNVRVEADPEFEFPRNGLRDLLFSLVREFLFNVVKHAGVDEAVVTLRRRVGWVEVEVEDEGRGFDASDLDASIDTLTGFGLRTAAQRLDLFGGSLRVDSSEGRAGTRVVASLPDPQLATDRGAPS